MECSSMSEREYRIVSDAFLWHVQDNEKSCCVYIVCSYPSKCHLLVFLLMSTILLYSIDLWEQGENGSKLQGDGL